MSLAARLEAGRSKPKFEEWIETLDKEDREALNAAALDPRMSSTAIEIAIRAAGCAISKETVIAWRVTRGYSG